MELIKVTTTECIKEGDSIAISGGGLVAEPFKVQKVKVSENDGTEIILNLRENTFFNMNMYLAGKSWVKEVVIVR